VTTIVCFGDSNTWGCEPRTDLSLPPARYPRGDRWPDVLAAHLGDGTNVIPEGLNGRTTCFDDPVEGEDRNGRRSLLPCLETHHPVDLLIIMLGVNDLKVRFAATAPTIAAGAASLAATAAASGFGPPGRPPEVLLIAPPPTRVGEVDRYLGHFAGADERSAGFAESFRATARLAGVHFLDAGAHIRSSERDGIHLEADAHHRLGAAVAGWISATLDLER